MLFASSYFKERSISGCFQVKETRWVFREEG